MIQEITFNNFCDAFPESYQKNFTYEGKKALFEYLESYEEDTGGKIELDIVALCCDYNEYKDLDEYLNEYNTDIEKPILEEFIEENKPEFLKEYDSYKKESVKNGLNLAESFFKWIAFVKKDQEIITEFQDLEEDFKKEVFEELEQKTTLIKIDEEAFIIQAY